MVPPSTAIPSCVGDLSVWEPVALHDFLLLDKDVMEALTAREYTATLGDVAAGLRLQATTMATVENWGGSVRTLRAGGRSSAAAAAAVEAAGRYNREMASTLTPELRVDILHLCGYTRLRDLFELARALQARRFECEGPMTAFLLERHRRGYTRTLLWKAEDVGLTVDSVDAWWAVFSVGDLLLALRARLSVSELEAVLVSGVFPDRDMLEMLAGLHAGKALPLRMAGTRSG